MVKKFYIGALVVSAISAILLLLVTISTPTTLSAPTPFYFVSSGNLGGVIDCSPNSNPLRLVNSIQFGTWGYCSSAVNASGYACFRLPHGYSATFGINPNGTTATTAAVTNVTIGASWTRGLAVHVATFTVSGVGLVLTAIPKQKIRMVAMGVNATAALMALIAFAIDIALFIYVQNQMRRIASKANTMPGPAFYMALFAILIGVGATVLNFFNWKRERDYDYSGGSAGEAWNSHQMEPTSTTTEATTAYGGASASERKVLDAYQESKAY